MKQVQLLEESGETIASIESRGFANFSIEVKTKKWKFPDEWKGKWKQTRRD